MKKIFVGNLPADTTDKLLTETFSTYGKVRSINVIKELFSGNCKGFAFIEMEGHEARAAITGLDGSEFLGKRINVKFEEPSKKGRNRR